MTCLSKDLGFTNMLLGRSVSMAHWRQTCLIGHLVETTTSNGRPCSDRFEIHLKRDEHTNFTEQSGLTKFIVVVDLLKIYTVMQ